MKTKLIFSPQLAQFLLHHGMEVVELKRKRGTYNETVFVFKYHPQLGELMEQWSNNKEQICGFTTL